MLRQFLHDRSTAREFGTTSTASARRASYRHEPMPRMTCTFVEDAQQERDELVADMGRGLIVESVTGGRVSLGDGAFTFDVKHGFLVDKGKVLTPVRDFRIVGSGPELLAGIRGVANDGKMDRRRVDLWQTRPDRSGVTGNAVRARIDADGSN